MTRATIGEIVGVHADTVGRWLKNHEQKGASALKPKRRGIRVGDARHLTPDQFRLSYALWTREAVRQLVLQETGLKMPIRTVGENLKRWGLTPQKPARRAYAQRPEVVSAWLRDEYPAIKSRAKQENAEIYWGDETGLRNDCQHGRGYAPKGKTPVISLNAKREGINMISAITNQGKVRFRLFEGGMNADMPIDFMKRLVKDAKRKVYLILDNLRVHHSKPVKPWLAENARASSLLLPAREDSLCGMTDIFYCRANSPGPADSPHRARRD